MRMSCNGCRVLRKGCSDNCSIRPCLEWIKSPESQAHATLFLAKFYGRAGLINLINAGPHHLRPAIFRSLLYEACGRIVNPIYGSVGLLWSGQWQLCQTAVDAVMSGASITPIAADAATVAPPIKVCDIRHVTNKEYNTLNPLKPTKSRFKRAKSKPKPIKEAVLSELNGSSTSHDSTVMSQYLDHEVATTDASVATVEKGDVEERESDGDGEVELELTLGFGLGSAQRQRSSEPKGDIGT